MTDRALSSVVGYALLLVVVGLLTSGLVVGATDYVDAERTEVTRTELDVVGNHLASDLTAADAVAGSLSPTGSATLRSELTKSVAGGNYRIEIDGTAGSQTYTIALHSDRMDVTRTVTVVTDRDILTATVQGGPLTINATSDRLEVIHD
jgi:hypothetical protein